MRVGEQRSVQRMILIAETGRLASIATLGHTIRQPRMTRRACRALIETLRFFVLLGNRHCNVQPHKEPIVRQTTVFRGPKTSRSSGNILSERERCAGTTWSKGHI